MSKLGVERNKDVKPISHRPAGPEIRAEKAQDERFEQARQEDRIIAGYRSKIDQY